MATWQTRNYCAIELCDAQLHSIFIKPEGQKCFLYVIVIFLSFTPGESDSKIITTFIKPDRFATGNLFKISFSYSLYHVMCIPFVYLSHYAIIKRCIFHKMVKHFLQHSGSGTAITKFFKIFINNNQL